MSSSSDRLWMSPDVIRQSKIENALKKALLTRRANWSAASVISEKESDLLTWEAGPSSGIERSITGLQKHSCSLTSIPHKEYQLLRNGLRCWYRTIVSA